MALNKHIAKALAPERLGPLLKGYEMRPGQLQMAEKVLDAFETNHVALIEAGTGTGKSLAYLLPAILWAHKTSERIVISTNTIALQEQLLIKDIPLALNLLEIDLPVVLAKGMGNYLCNFRLKSRIDEASLFHNNRTDLLQIAQQASYLQSGCKSEFPFQIPFPIWSEIKAESETCLGNKCPSFSSCFFFQARKALEEAKIILVNHHLLLSDLSLRGDKALNSSTCILPSFSRLILDEGHHLEEIALSYFARKVEQKALLYDMKKLTLTLQQLKQLLVSYEKLVPEISKLLIEMDTEWALSRRSFAEHLDAFFAMIDEKVLSRGAHKKTLLQKDLITSSFWKEQVCTKAQILLEKALRLQELFQFFDKKIPQIGYEKLTLNSQGSRSEALASLSRIQEGISILNSIATPAEKEEVIRWCESEGAHDARGISFSETPFDIASTIKKNLFDKLPTCVISSATLTIRNSFRSICEQIGLNSEGEDVKLSQFESPFDYEKNALFVVPTDLVPPDHPNHESSLSPAILELIKASRGGSFVLFTSFNSLEKTFAQLQVELQTLGYLPLKQGALPRSQLLRDFKSHQNAVLFGTDSFWEGVDVAGPALRQVIITKLPFQPPNDPLAQARSEYLSKQGKNPFVHYWLPKAIVKFKQGFGRLIRSKEDFGSVICLDTRILQKSYGKLFIDSIPQCTPLHKPMKEVLRELNLFYNKKLNVRRI